ncbi:uncharacterized protein LOC123564235 [Mercenaria mercenaria]|uniref:uncharacterized protein LOC123564235 n=1 Tax=Mercenaria mercenaria TaxID=6596 RepID=UPI00234F3661|nr:uncharacterized protein LOC123564235 [Mercenaria mercenaria]
MAAPTYTARIGLAFDKPDLENSWFLVDFSKHDKIEDVIIEIKNQYFKCVTDCDKAVTLRINNFLLPPNGSSELFRENDVVSVRLETKSENRETLAGKWVHSCIDDSSRQISSSHSLAEDLEDHKRKRKHSETVCEHGEVKYKSLKHKKRKHRDRHLSEEVLEHLQFDSNSSQYTRTKQKSKGHVKNSKSQHKVECMVETSHSESSTGADIKHLPTSDNGELEISKSREKSAIVNSEQVLRTDRNDSAVVGSEYKQDVAVSNFTRDTADTETEESLVNISQSDVSSLGSTEKKKRNRRRKRRHRSLSNTLTGDATDKAVDSGSLGLNDSHPIYKGREVDGNERGLYGSLPDKLESPKYYRHGYRNSKTYSVEPNQHVKFGSDSDPEEVEESTQQYNFLCKSRKTPKTVINSGTEFSETEDGAQDKIEKTETAVREETKIDESVYAQNDSQFLQNGTCEDLQQNEQPSQNDSFTAVPFNYADSSEERSNDNTTNSSFAKETSPVTLERKTLSNGVSVFVRQRASPGSRFRGLSKQEQLDTKVTNVSTIFVTTQEPEFKVPSSPAPRQKLSPKPCLPEVKDSLTGTNNLQGVELSSCKPLVGTPKAGDTIAYKVLEISANCTPEVSDFRIAKVLSIDDNQMLELKNVFKPDNSDKQVTKFHVEIEDDNEILTNTESLADIVTLHLSSLLEPRIVASGQ